MAAFTFCPEYKAFIKLCSKCRTTYVGHYEQEKAEVILNIHFASDKYTLDGFYGLCRSCVAKANKAKRDGRACNPEEMLREQGSKCAICSKEISLEGRKFVRNHAYVDHDHSTNKIRGLLCHKCNSALGIVENKEWLTKALAYLVKHKS